MSRANLLKLTFCSIWLLTAGMPSYLNSADPLKPAPKAAWTVLVYLAADCNLEDSMLGNLEELAEVGSDQKVQFVVLADRSSRGAALPSPDENAENTDEENSAESPPDGAADESADQALETEDGFTNRKVINLEDWSGAKLLHIEDGHLRELADWGETDMAAPATLERFIKQGQQFYPAERFLLVISDHGMGWQGACHDESSNKAMTIPQMSQALARVFAKQKVDVLGFDCCLMGNFEVAHTLAPQVGLFIGSEELVPGTGWNYATFGRLLKRKPQLTAAELCEEMAESYRDYFTKSNRQTAAGVTLSVIETSRMGALETALNGLAKLLETHLEKNTSVGWAQIARARSHSNTFSGELVDLADFAKHLSEEVTDEKIKTAAVAVVSANKQAVLHNVHGKQQKAANGLTIHFPLGNLTDEVDASEPRYADLKFGKGPWGTFLAKLAEQTAQEEIPPLLKEVKASGELVDSMRVLEITSQLDLDNAENVDFVLARSDGEKTIILGRTQTWASEEGTLHEELAANWPALMVGDRGVLCTILRQAPAEEPDEVSDAAPPEILLEMPVQIQRKGTRKWLLVTLTFAAEGAPADGETEEEAQPGEFLYAIREDKDGIQEFEIAAGDSLRMLKTEIDRRGRVKEVPDSNSKPIRLKGPEDLSLGAIMLSPGDYRTGFLAQNLAGQAEVGYVSVKVAK